MSQLFKTQYPLEKLKEYILKICECTDNSTYIFSKICFKRALISGLAAEFITDVLPHYHKSKQKYADATALNYKSTANVLRQLCKFHNIHVESKMRYDKSSYEIEYVIHPTPRENNATPPNCQPKLDSLIDEQTTGTCYGSKHPSQE